VSPPELNGLKTVKGPERKENRESTRIDVPARRRFRKPGETYRGAEPGDGPREKGGGNGAEGVSWPFKKNPVLSRHEKPVALPRAGLDRGFHVRAGGRFSPMGGKRRTRDLPAPLSLCERFLRYAWVRLLRKKYPQKTKVRKTWGGGKRQLATTPGLWHYCLTRRQGKPKKEEKGGEGAALDKKPSLSNFYSYGRAWNHPHSFA